MIPTSRLFVISLLLASVAIQRAGAQSWTDITANLPVAPKVGSGQSLASDGSALYALASPNGILRSTDNGATWSTLNSVSGGAYDLSQFGSRSIDAIGTTLWAGGEPGSGAITQGILPLHRTTAPAAWTPSFAGAAPPFVIDAVAFDSSTNTHWAAGALGGIFKSTDGGSTWTAANGNLPATGCVSIVARNGKVVAAIPGNGMGAFTSVDGGVTWTNNGVPLPEIGFLTSIGDQVCVIGGGSTNLTTGVYFSQDFGITWQFTQKDTAAGAKILTNTCADTTTMFAGGQLLYTPSFVFVRQGTVAFSKNGGMTWDDIPAAGLGGGIGKQVERLARHGTFLFALTGENKLYRLDLTTVTLTPTLKIAVEPKPAKSLVGGTLTMKVFAGGPGTLTYQWKKGAADVPGQTTDTFTLTNAQPSDTGDYICVVTSGANSVTSAVARGTVVERLDGRYDPSLDRTNVALSDTGTPFVQADGSVLVLNGGGVYKLGPNGGKTDSRAIGGTTGYNGRLVDSSGRILLGGIQGNTSTHRVRRLLNTAGFPDDPTFPQLATNSATNATIRGIRELPGAGYLVWGDFSQLGPAGGTLVTVPRVVLVDYDGSLNTTFNTNIQTLLGLGVSATPYPLQDGTAWLLGPNLTRINATGQKVAGHTDYDTSNPSTVLHFAHALKSGKLLVGLRNSGSTREFKLFNTNGTFDSAFNTANLTLNNAIGIAAEQADGKIVVGGNFTSYGSNACNGRIMRINADGTFDSTFYNAAGFSTAGVTGMAYDPRGYVYLVNENNNATTGNFQDASTMGDTIGRNIVRVFTTAAPASGTSFATWASGISFPPGKSGMTDDAENDGLTNLEEFAFGSDPLSGSGSQGPEAGLPAVIGPDTYPTIAFNRRTDAVGITLSVEADGTIPVTGAYPTSLVSTTPLGGGIERVVYRSNVSLATDSSQFLRIRISAP
ncbi:MAG: hypothetical protein MUF86_03670 [Akkermansiaceae bacterium]|nr:hypothetical protein [Akkermansiaceae bacterium]